MEKIPFTPQGLHVIKEELAHLKGIERQAVINAIAVAREHGDLSENAEYHAAREKQSFIEGRISELEDVTSRAEVIDAGKLNGEKVTFGTSVGVVDEETDGVTPLCGSRKWICRTMEKIPFTPQGLHVIKEELAHLKGIERQAVINAIAVAREHGDLSENAEYHAAREKQSFIEGRISELEM